MSNVRPTLSEYQEPEPGTQLEVTLDAFSRALLWGVLLFVLTAGVSGVSISRDYLDDDAARVRDNRALSAWPGIWPIWRQALNFPDVSPVTYTSFLVEARVWGTNRPASATGFRLVNVLLHACVVLLLWHLLARLEIPGAWSAAAVFGVHPVAVASAGWISQRPAILGSLFALMMLVVLFRLMGLNPRPDETHRVFRLPERAWLLWIAVFVLLTLTALTSPALAITLAPVTAVIVWWEHGRVSRADLLRLLPLVVASVLIAAATAYVTATRGAEGWVLADAPTWYRPLAAVQQLVAYAVMVLLPIRLQFGYQPFAVLGSGFYLALIAGVMVLTGAFWATRFYGRGPLAVIGIFALLLLPAIAHVEQTELFGGWVGVQRLYPAAAVLVVGVVAVAAYALQTRREPAMLLAVVALTAFGAAGAYHAFLRRSPERLWDHTLAIEPTHIAAGVHKAARLLDAKQTLAAEAELTRLARANPNRVEPLLELARLEESRGEHQRALSGFLLVLRLEPDNYEATFGLARVKGALNDSTGALAQYQKALALRPRDAFLHNNIGMLHAERGDLPEAEQWYRKAIAIDPAASFARINLANLLYQKGLVDEAAAELLTIVQVYDRENFEAYMNGGAMMGQMKQYSQAAQMFRKAVTLRPEMPHAYSNLAMALIGQSEIPGTVPSERVALLSEAVFMFEKAAEIAPNTTEFAANARSLRQRRDAELNSGNR